MFLVSPLPHRTINNGRYLAMLLSHLLSRRTITLVAILWVGLNALLLNDDLSTVSTLFAQSCVFDSVVNTTDCATSQSVTCTTWCNDACSKSDGTVYQGTEHGVAYTGGNKEQGSFWAVCYYKYPCQEVVKQQHRCQAWAEGNYCDENHPLNNCRYCAAGTLEPVNVWDFRVVGCPS